MEYTLVRTNRKTLAVYVRKDATVEVRAPLRMPKKEIERFLEEKQDWVERKLSETREIKRQKDSFTLRPGDSLSLFGKQYPLEKHTGRSCGFDGLCFFVPDNAQPSEFVGYVTGIYKSIARKHLSERASHFADIMGVEPAGISISSADTRWGSCSGKGRITFSWHLVLAETELVDYVVVHELAHLKHLDHSRAFWADVEKLVPDWKEKRAGLAAVSEKLARENWKQQAE